MMRVLLVSHGFQPEYEAGFANGLALNGVAVELITSDRSLVDQFDKRILARNLRGSQDPARPAWVKALNLFRYYGLLFAHLLATRGSPVHVMGLFAINNPIAWAIECLLFRLTGHSLLLTVHNVVPHGDDTKFVRLGLWLAYRVPKRLVVHTARAKLRLVSEFGIAGGRVIVMEHGIRVLPEVTLSDSLNARARLGVPGQSRLVVFFGAVLPYKGVDLLLEAANVLSPNARVLIAGMARNPDYAARIRKLIARYGLTQRVEWTNRYLSASEVDVVLSAADVLAMPYRQIDQSGVLFSAAAYGVPVVAFDVGSLRDYLVRFGGVVVPPGDVSKFAAALESVVPATESRLTIQKEARRFLWENTVHPVLPEYKSQCRPT